MRGGITWGNGATFYRFDYLWFDSKCLNWRFVYIGVYPRTNVASFYVAYILFVAILIPIWPLFEKDEKHLRKTGNLKGVIAHHGGNFYLGSIYGGIASVTEASAIGVMGVLLSIIIRREFSYSLLKGCVTNIINLR